MTRWTLTRLADAWLDVAEALPSTPADALSLEDLARKAGVSAPLTLETLRQMGAAVRKRSGRYYRITNRS